MGITRMTREHLGLAIALKIPVVGLFNNCDDKLDNSSSPTLLSICLKLVPVLALVTLSQKR